MLALSAGSSATVPERMGGPRNMVWKSDGSRRPHPPSASTDKKRAPYGCRACVSYTRTRPPRTTPPLACGSAETVNVFGRGRRFHSGRGVGEEEGEAKSAEGGSPSRT